MHLRFECDIICVRDMIDSLESLMPILSRPVHCVWYIQLQDVETSMIVVSPAIGTANISN